jgi:battenin
MIVNSINMFIGFLIISLACTYDQVKASFFLSLVASVILGTVSAFGESTTLGFCKGFPSTVVGYFGSGTGFAGVFGSGMILALKSADLSNGQIFFSIMPSVIPYFLAFWWVNHMKAKYPYVMEVPALASSSSNNYLSMTETDEIIEE